MTEAARAYATAMLDRAMKLREHLDPQHAAVRAAAGDIPAELVERARNLVLSRLVGG